MFGLTRGGRQLADDSAGTDGDDGAVEAGCDPNVVHLALRAAIDLEVQDTSDGQISVMVESVVHGFRVNGGDPLAQEFRVNGDQQQILSKVSAIGILHLWQALTAG